MLVGSIWQGDLVTVTFIIGGAALAMLAAWLGLNGRLRRWLAARRTIHRRLMSSPHL